MPGSIDTSRFQPVAELDGGDAEETALLKQLAVDANQYVRSLAWAPPVDRMHLAFGVGGILGLFLARFERPVAGTRAQEFWIVVGDLPDAYAAAEGVEEPRIALELYCYAMEDWANQVLSGGDLAEVYPVQVEPTEEHARMLLSRIQFIRDEFVPIANEGPVILDDPDRPEADVLSD